MLQYTNCICINSLGFEQWIHPYQDIEHVHHPRKFPSLSVPCNFYQVAATVLNFNCGFILAVWKFHVNGIIPFVLFCVQLLSLRVMCVRSILVIKCLLCPFYCWVIYYFINILQFTHSPVDEHLGCF